MKNEIKKLGEISLELFPELNSQIAFSDFCAPAGTIDFKVYNGFLRNSLKLFSLKYKDFIFEAKVRDGMIFIMRNGIYQHSEQYLGNEMCQVALQWNIDSIGCGIVPPNATNDMNHHLKAVHTPVTTFPSNIVDILRKEDLLDNSVYKDMDTFFTTIIDSLHCCQNDIRRHGSERLFWEKLNNSSLKPIDEPNISRGIASFLSIYGALKNFNVTCEPIAGLGYMDFHIVAPVGNRLEKIVLEAKKAESGNLITGFTSQLPNYMKRIGTDYGIYLVYWLKSINYPYPKQYNEYSALEIEKLHPIKRKKSIRTIGFNLSLELSPSKKLYNQ